MAIKHNYEDEDVRKSESGRDSITKIVDYNQINEDLRKEISLDNIYDEIDLDYGSVRIFTRGKSAATHFFPDEELKDDELIYGLTKDDAEIRKDYSDTIESVQEIYDGKENLGELLDQL